MTQRTVTVPIKVVSGRKWGALMHFGLTHEIVGETVSKVNDKFSFAGGHRVRLYKFRKNVHWRIPTEAEIDIEAVPPSESPRRR